MIPYFVLYTFIFIFWGLSIYFPRKKDIFYSLTAIVLLAFVAFRHESMGVDLGSPFIDGYLASFDTIGDFSWKAVFELKSFLNYEKGYVLFNKLVASIYHHRQFFLLCCAILSLAPILSIIQKKSKKPFLSILILLGSPCFLLTYSALRQSIAIAIAFASIQYIKQKKLTKFAVLILLSSTFHSSALIFLLAYPIYHFKQSKVTQILSILAIPTAYVCRTPLFSILSKLFKPEASPDNNGAITLFIVFCAIYLFSVLFGNQMDSELVGYQNLFLCACICQAFGGVYSTAIRVGYYFIIILVLLIPKIICMEREVKLVGISFHYGTPRDRDAFIQQMVFCVIVAICFTSFGLYSIYKSSWSEAYPYLFFWQN